MINQYWATFILWVHQNSDSLLIFGAGVIVGGLTFGGHARRAFGWGHRSYRRWRGYY